MRPEYSVEPLTAANLQLLKPLFGNAFGAEPSEEHLRQRFSTAALGADVIGFLAIDRKSGIAAAYYGVFPVRIQVNGKPYLAAQSGDTMTHSDHRKKGLFLHLARLTFDACRAQGIALVFGLPNPNSYPGFVNRLNWKHRDDVVRYDLKLGVKTLPLPRLLRKAGLPGTYLSYARMILKRRMVPEPPTLHNSLPLPYGKILRNGPYLQYKRSPDKWFIRIGAATAWIRLADTLWIGDFSDAGKVDGAVLRGLKRIAFLLGYNTLSFHLNRSIERPSFLKSFRAYEEEPLCYFPLQAELENLNLLLTGADFDTW